MKSIIDSINPSAEQKLKFENKLKEEMERLTHLLKCDKLAKFQRDQNDYKEGNVDTWTQIYPTPS